MNTIQLGGSRGLVEQPRPGGLRVLVVEDHADLRSTLQAFLRLLGHQARFAGGIASALREAREESFDVLLSDIGLPDGSGWELPGRLQEIGRLPAYAIAMSGFGLGIDTDRSREAGFAVHLVKPFAPERLDAILAQAAAEILLA